MFPNLKTKQNILASIFFLLLNFAFTIAQNHTEITIYDWFDNEIGIENLDYNNGLLFTDLYPATANSFRFLKNNDFTKGEIIFNNQYYNSIFLNYDAYNDDLLIKPLGANDRKRIILQQDQTDSFVFDGQKFVNLDYLNKAQESFIKGYYEELFLGSSLGLYIKHSKIKRQVLTNENVLYEFDPEKEFIVYRNHQYFKINSKKTALHIFPEFEAKIDTFYTENNVLENSDKTLFFKKLILLLESATRNN